MANLKVSNLTAVVGSFVLNIPSLEIGAGKIVAVMGESGSGKSTLLNCLAGFLPIRSGSVVVGDKELTGLPPEKRKMALVFQRPSLFPHLNVRENVEFALRLQGVPERASRARTWLRRLNIGELEERRYDEISEGQAQRVSLARALASEFPVLLLDEPFSALDEKTRLDLRKTLREIVTESGVAALLVTHHPEDARAIADQIITLDRGGIVQDK